MSSEDSYKAGDISEKAVSKNEGITNKIPEAERGRILRKVDIHLLPWVSILYLLSFLDRINFGNAKIAGMARDAHLTGLKFNIAAAVFFMSYALAEIPSNIILKLVRPSRWIPSIMVAWGIVMTLMSLCKTFDSLLIARVFLGLTEAGLFPGVVFYLSLWYRRQDVALRIAIFFSATTAAGAFSGILAFGIERMEGIGHLHGWQWIFCLEGLATIVIATISYFVMYDYPDTASFLTPHEKHVVISMLEKDNQGLATHFDAKFIWQALSDYKPYILSLNHLCVSTPAYAIALFLPTIINSLGYSAATAQLLSIPPYVFACAASILVAYFSDKCNLRGPFIIGGSIVSLVGFIILITQVRPGVGYVGTIIAATGLFPLAAVDLAWVSSIAGGDVRKGVTIAMAIAAANLGAICSSFIYLKPPRFFVGHGTCIGLLTIAIFLTSFCMWDFQRQNKAKEVDCAARGFDESRKGEFTELGSESPLFRFTI